MSSSWSSVPGHSGPVLPAEAFLPPTPAGVARAAELLRQGKLVVVPTETVYGIALNLHSAEARQAARQIKTRAAEGAGTVAPWVVHVESPEELLSWVPHISAVGRRLVTKSLPGPIAFQMGLDEEEKRQARERLEAQRSGEPEARGSAAETLATPPGASAGAEFITLRCPDFGVTLEVLRAMAGVPVAIVGAGTPAQPGIFEAADVPAGLLSGGKGGGEVAAVLDGGPTRYRRSSTLVRIDGEKYEVVRPGVIDERIIHKLADFTVLFLCSGNTCRSPMAAALAAKMLADKLHIPVPELPLRHIVVQSAGLHASRGMRAALEGMEAVKGLGADLTGHISQPATTDLLRRADVIYTMTDAHREEVLELVPGAEKKTFRLDPEGDIADPIGSPFPVYERVARKLASVLENRLSELPV